MDSEHYLSGLFFPRNTRKHYFAVRAFNIELAIIKDVISDSDPNIGTMRLDFWRQVINSCYKVCCTLAGGFVLIFF
jgi:NADH dehydrogenase [ubiquinone] 1 alpha subcomplex assembly factor 6